MGSATTFDYLLVFTNYFHASVDRLQPVPPPDCVNFAPKSLR